MMGTLATEIAGHMSRMYRVALRIVGSADVAQEVAQDACVKALRGPIVSMAARPWPLGSTASPSTAPR